MNQLIGAALLVLFVTLAISTSTFAEKAWQKSDRVQAPSLLTYSRLYTGADGETHFEDVTVDFIAVEHGDSIAPIWMSVTGQIKTEGFRFFVTAAGWDGREKHPSPQRQFLFVISGVMEIIASDGESRTFGPGKVLLVEDVARNKGKGHSSQMVSSSIGVFVIVPLADE